MAADRYAVATGASNSTSVWSATSGGAPGASAPGAADTAIFDAASGAIAVTIAAGGHTWAALNMAGYAGALAIGAQTLISTGAAVLEAAGGLTSDAGGVLECQGSITYNTSAGSWSGFDGTLKATGTNGATLLLTPAGEEYALPQFEIDNNVGVASFTYAGAYALRCLQFTFTAGKYDGNDKGVYIFGTGSSDANFTTDGGTWTNSGTVMLIGDGSLDTEYTTIPDELALYDGVTATIANGTQGQASKLTVPITATITAPGTGKIEIRGGVADFWNVAGTIDCDVVVANTEYPPGADVTITGDHDLTIETTSTRDITAANNGAWASDVDTAGGTLSIRGTGNGDVMTVEFTGDIITNQIVDGRDAAYSGSGVISLGPGNHRIGGGGIARGNAANSANAIALETCNLTLDGGEFNATGITVTNDGAAIHGGTVSNCDVSGSNPLNAINGVTDGTGNTDVIFEGDSGEENFPPVGTMQTLGIGT
jgi:hypothetical protein